MKFFEIQFGKPFLDYNVMTIWVFIPSWVMLQIWFSNKSIAWNTLDNITWVLVAFNNFTQKRTSLQKKLYEVQKTLPKSLVLDVHLNKVNPKTYAFRKRTSEKSHNTNISEKTWERLTLGSAKSLKNYASNSPKIKKSRVIITKNMIKSKKLSKKHTKQYLRAINQNSLKKDTKTNDFEANKIHLSDNSKGVVRTRNYKQAPKKFSGSIMSIAELIKSTGTTSGKLFYQPNPLATFNKRTAK